MKSKVYIFNKKSLLLILLFIAIVAQQSFSQQLNRDIDSLKKFLQTAADDTNKVNAFNALCEEFIKTAPKKGAIASADSAIALARTINFKRGEARGYYFLGYSQSTLDDFSTALKNYQVAVKNFEEIGDKKGIAETDMLIGQLSGYRGNYPEALKIFLKALELDEEVGFKAGIADAYNKIGTVQRRQHNYAEALKNHQRALKIFNELGDIMGMGDAHNLMGMNYWLLGNPREALKEYELGLKYRKQIACKAAVAGSYNNIGELYYSQGNYPEALKNFLAGLKINKDEIEVKYGTSISYINMGRVYTKMAKYREAQKYLSAGLSMSKEIDNKENIRDAYEALSILDSAAGEPVPALIHYKLYILYKDSMMNENTLRQVAQMKEIYESEKKDKEIALLNKEKTIRDLELKKQRQAKNYFIAGLVLFAVLSFVIYKNYHARQKLKLLTLRNKIASDLHDDVGSTLSSVSIFSQMAQEQSRETIPLLETIGESSRKMLDAMADIVWTIKPENDQFEKIIMRMRSFAYELLGAKKIDFEFVADDEVAKINLRMEVRKNLYLIFKEATNNMVKYAEADKARFDINTERNNLMMMIRDNGKGFDVQNLSEGNGLKNMRKRADEIGAKLVIDSIPGSGTTIQLSVAV